MDLQTIAAILFVAFITHFVIKNREKITLQKIAFPFLYFAMYKTNFGINSMNSISRKIPRLLKLIAYAGIVVGLLGMVLISFSLVYNLVKMIITPAATAGVALVLPFKVKGSFYVPFFYWIISIFVLAVIHEFSHGVIARVYNVKVKSSGFAFLGVILPVLPAAFVEPDEKELKKKSVAARLSIFAAGPFSNILFAAFVAVLFWLLFAPLSTAIFEPDGIQVAGYIKGADNMTFPAEEASIKEGEIIKSINNVEVLTIKNFTAFMNTTRPGQQVTIKTNITTYTVALAEDPEIVNKSYLGVYVRQSSRISQNFREKYGKIATTSLIWIIGLFYWFYILNLGIGLFNLVPIGPIDGGRIVHTILTKYLREDIALKVGGFISSSFLFMIFASILFALLK